MDEMKISKHLDRIKVLKNPLTNLVSLRHLQKQHLLNVPFENLDIHYGKKITCDVSKFYKKIVEEKRGGFCYELNGLFYWLLSELGFEVKMIAANVYDSAKEKYGIDFNHMTLMVKIGEEEYLTDVGFGAFKRILEVIFLWKKFLKM